MERILGQEIFGVGGFDRILPVPVALESKEFENGMDQDSVIGHFESNPPRFSDGKSNLWREGRDAKERNFWFEGINEFLYMYDMCVCKPSQNGLQLEMKSKKNEDSSVTLHFNNPTTSLSTRCDVIYKGLLRDCRKFFSDKFESRQFRKSKSLNSLDKKIDDFVSSCFFRLRPQHAKGN